jgi:hypothetical protein
MNSCAMVELKQEVVKTLLYFDIFSYPLRIEEIQRFCSLSASQSEISEAVNQLITEKQIYRAGSYYLVQNRDDWRKEREERHRYSVERIKMARKMAGIIGQFPFVRGVAISGSLSKYFADNNADIDYFIICKAGRLWISRSLLHIFKKFTFLAGMQHYFCMNHFLDYDELELKDKNLYTALESATLIPIYGGESYRAFFQRNNWIREFFPNYDLQDKLKRPIYRKQTWIKRLFEALFNGLGSPYLNNSLRAITVWWWRNKFRWQGVSLQHFDQDLRSTAGESKYHPNDYQRIILASYWKRVRLFEERVHS